MSERWVIVTTGYDGQERLYTKDIFSSVLDASIYAQTHISDIIPWEVFELKEIS